MCSKRHQLNYFMASTAGSDVQNTENMSYIREGS